MAAGAPVLVVGLRDGYHVAGIGPAVQVGPRPVAPEAGVGSAPPQGVQPAAIDLLGRGAIRDADGVEVEVGPGSLRERVEVFEAVLGPRPEATRNAVGLGPDVGLQPPPALLLQGEYELVNVGMAL